jgi:carbon-monoxide dehydrogenase medium subunit
MKPAPFEYHLPESAREAASLLAECGDSAKLLAGGQSLIPMLALRMAAFDHLIDLRRAESLAGIERVPGWVRLGAMTTEATVGADPAVRSGVPLLARATPLIGHFQIRNRGTIGGSIAHADPAAEYPAVALALDAVLEAVSPLGGREVPASEFFTGLWETRLAPDEVLTGIRFPVWDGRCGFAIEEFARRHGDFAIAGAAVALELGPDGRVARCAVGLIGLGMKPERPRHAEAAVTGTSASDVDPGEFGQLAVSELADVPSDLHGSAQYRAKVGAEMVARAWKRAREEAGKR